jgi:hypothetical protein
MMISSLLNKYSIVYSQVDQISEAKLPEKKCFDLLPLACSHDALIL